MSLNLVDKKQEVAENAKKTTNWEKKKYQLHFEICLHLIFLTYKHLSKMIFLPVTDSEQR